MFQKGLEVARRQRRQSRVAVLQQRLGECRAKLSALQASREQQVAAVGTSPREEDAELDPTTANCR